MIVTVTLNLALDVTYTVAEVEWHAANRVSAVAERAGGKGVNVARVLAALGHATVVCGFAGGPTGDAIAEELAAARLEAVLTPIAGHSRRTVAVVDSSEGDATGFWEPGPTVTSDEWRAFLGGYDTVLADARAVVLSGSLPPGTPTDAYAELCRRAGDAGVPAILDADGEALRAGLAGRPAVIKPNREELARVAEGVEDTLAAARQLQTAGADSVVVSLGAEGMLAVTPDGIWRAAPSERVAGNPTGAGDAAVAALAAGLVEGRTVARAPRRRGRPVGGGGRSAARRQLRRGAVPARPRTGHAGLRGGWAVSQACYNLGRRCRLHRVRLLPGSYQRTPHDPTHHRCGPRPAPVAGRRRALPQRRDVRRAQRVLRRRLPPSQARHRLTQAQAAAVAALSNSSIELR